jgi:hypothetical protein
MPRFERYIGIDFRPCRHSVAAALAVRRLEHPRRPLRDRRVYPSLWRRGFALEGRTPDRHDAFCIAAWLGRADRDGTQVRSSKRRATRSLEAVSVLFL